MRFLDRRKNRGRYMLTANPASPVRGTILPAPAKASSKEWVPVEGESFEHWWLRIPVETAVEFAMQSKGMEKTPSDLYYTFMGDPK